MKVFALTGGVASGKSTAMDLIAARAPGAVLFDCDHVVGQLLDGDGELRDELVAHFGDGILGDGGGLDRAALRGRVFGDDAERRWLEGRVHPRVREECLESLARARQSRASLFVADVPLLFESAFDFGQDLNLLVAVEFPTQLRRLRARNGFDEELARSILAAQMPGFEKIRRADVVFWNEGSREVLRDQIHRFFHSKP